MAEKDTKKNAPIKPTKPTPTTTSERKHYITDSADKIKRR